MTDVSMLPFLEHVENCKRCRETPKRPCVTGYRLFHQGADRLTDMLAYDPKRAKA